MKKITNEFHLHGADGFCTFTPNGGGQPTPIDGPIVVKVEQEGEEIQWNDHTSSIIDFVYRKNPNLTVSGTSRNPVQTLQPGVIHANAILHQPKGTALFVTCQLVCVLCEKIKDSDRYSFLLTDDVHDIIKAWQITLPPPPPMKLENIGKLQSLQVPDWLREFQESVCRRQKLFEVFQTSHANSPEAADVPLIIAKKQE